MRVMVTGHNGYIGTVLVRLLQQAGHEVVGFDSYMFADCTLGPDWPDIPAVRKDLRDVEPEDIAGVEAICHLAGISNDPVGDLDADTTYAINHHAAAAPGGDRRRRGCRALRLLIVVQHLRRFTGSIRHRGVGDKPGYAIRVLQDLRRGGHPGACLALIQPHLPAERHRIRLLAAGQGRPGGQQPRGLCGDRGSSVDEERWQSVATAGAHRGHLPGICRCRRSAAGTDPRPGAQRGKLGGELPDPRCGRHSPACSAGERDRPLRNRRARYQGLPGRLLEDRGKSFPPSPRNGR